MTPAPDLPPRAWRGLAQFFARLLEIGEMEDGAQPRAILQALRALVGADDAFLVLAMRAPAAQLMFLHTHRIVLTSRRTRAYLREELISEHDWRRSPTCELLQALDVGERVVEAHALAEHVEVYAGLDRVKGGRPFRPAEREVLRQALCGLRPFGVRLARRAGYLDALQPLSPRERDVLGALLCGRSEKELAQELGLTPRSAHQYVTAIYRKFGVHGRVELMALWL